MGSEINLNFPLIHTAGGTEQIIHDNELQSWRHEIASPMEEGGLGLVGVPGSTIKVSDLLA